MTEFQAMLRDSLDKALARHYGFEQRQALRRARTGFSHAAWRAYADLGLFALSVPEERGGLGGSFADLGVVAEALGGALALEPVLPGIVFGSRLIADAGSPAQRSALLPALLAGECKAALAHDEPTTRYRLDRVESRAIRSGDGYRLNGGKCVSIGGGDADLLVVSAHLDGHADLSLFLVPAGARGVTRKAYLSFEGGGVADVVLDDVQLDKDALLGPAHGGTALLGAAMAEAVALDCMDAIGAMRAAFALTHEHVRTRRQFGATIGSFQVVQHRLVDMATALEMAAAIAGEALRLATHIDPATRDRAVSAAKVRVAESARFIGQQTVQLHGGMGLAEEYPAAHHFARLGMFMQRWGDSDHHLRRFAALMETDPEPRRA